MKMNRTDINDKKFKLTRWRIFFIFDKQTHRVYFFCISSHLRIFFYFLFLFSINNFCDYWRIERFIHYMIELGPLSPFFWYLICLAVKINCNICDSHYEFIHEIFIFFILFPRLLNFFSFNLSFPHIQIVLRNFNCDIIHFLFPSNIVKHFLFVYNCHSISYYSNWYESFLLYFLYFFYPAYIYSTVFFDSLDKLYFWVTTIFILTRNLVTLSFPTYSW